MVCSFQDLLQIQLIRMPEPETPPRTFAFADFILSPQDGTLVHRGHKVRLQDQPLRLLALLVERAGEVVTREEIQAHLWPENTYVEFDKSLRVAINKVREALRDSADRPNFIETVPRRGYRFIAPVGVQFSAPQPTVLTPDPAPPIRQTDGAVGVVEDPAPPSGASHPRAHLAWRLVLLAIPIALLLTVPVTVLLRSHGFTRPGITAYTKITYDGHPKSFGGTDGSRIYFKWEDTGKIAEVSVSGGAVAPIPVALNYPRIGEISPDGSTLLLTSEGSGLGPADTLWSMEVLGGTLRRLGNAVSATWSPDGKQISYGTAQGDICIMRRDGTDALRIVAAGGYVSYIAWSPDGQTIRFSRDGLLWEVSKDGSNLRQLLPGWPHANQWSGRWAGDGRFFFVADGQIWFLGERRRIGSEFVAKPVQLTNGPTVWDRPVPSQDGKKIFASGSTRRGELMRFDAGSSMFQPFLDGISAEFVRFSRNGKSVAYVTYPEGILWRANADGSNPLKLTEAPVYPKSISWSPDGSQICFVDRTAEGVYDIFVILSDGSEKPRRLLPDDRQAETDPSWSPDGKQIIFSTSPNVGASAKSDLRTVDLGTGKTTVLPASEGLVVPHWSPDGKKIAAVTLDVMGMKLFDIASCRWTNLDTGSVAFPEWSSDGQWIYYIKWTPDSAVVRVRTQDGKREPVIDLKGVRCTGVFSIWLGLDPTDAPMMLRDVGTEDIYSLTLDSK